MKRALSAATLLALAALRVLAASSTAQVLATQVNDDVERLALQPPLLAWQDAFPEDQLQLAHYETDRDPYQVDFTRLATWCAAEVAMLPDHVTRAALFYVPEAHAGALRALPPRPDATLTNQCQAQALWYGTEPGTSTRELVSELTGLWGVPNGPSSKPMLRGSGLWIEVSSWRRSGLTVWVAYDRQTWLGNAARPHVIVYVCRDFPPDSFHPTTAIGTFFDADAAARTAARIAGLDSPITAPIVAFAGVPFGSPQQVTPPIAAKNFAEWFAKGTNLPPPRRAAVYFLADLYLSRTQRDAKVDGQYTALGARFDGGCPQDGPAYGNTFLHQAERIDPLGSVGELARLQTLTSPCLLKGKKLWADLLTDSAAAAVQDFSQSAWLPYYQFVLGRAHAIKLAYSYPVASELDASEPVPAAQAPALRAAAIHQFRLFLNEKPNAPESVFAWQEAWRLLAGLPPTLIEFGCSCE